jgi:hypothetical protein
MTKNRQKFLPVFVIPGLSARFIEAEQAVIGAKMKLLPGLLKMRRIRLINAPLKLVGGIYEPKSDIGS